jgi:hypothetical protein
MFALQPPFLLGANGRKCDRERQKILYFSCLQSKQMVLVQTIQDYASLLLYEMNPSGKSKFLLVKLDLQLTTGNSLVVTHINARCQAFSLPLRNYGKTKMGRKPLRTL